MNTKSIQSLQWRRDKVRELTIKGNTQRDIAAALQINLRIVNKDLQYLRTQAKNNIMHYIDEQLPAEYEGAVNTLNMITKEMWELTPKDNRELIQSRQLIKECTAMKVELIASGTVVDRAIKFVERNRPIIIPQGSIQENKEVVIDDSREPEQISG